MAGTGRQICLLHDVGLRGGVGQEGRRGQRRGENESECCEADPARRPVPHRGNQLAKEIRQAHRTRGSSTA